ncbi:exodeoxyribonuclease VII large subunit [Litorivicinus lipolyticus]|uniref:exodeoxyribonuclease VII large subunit n=1 Tax=Litorivicinus lipolyticus TaxID=418701 RepID=UPI003B58F80A
MSNHFAEQNTTNALSVTQLSSLIQSAVSTAFPQWIWLEGEVSGFKTWGRPIVKGWFFDLKDERTTLPCAVWATDIRSIKTPPKEGERVRALVNVSWASKQGRLSLHVKRIEAVGIGALLADIERRRQQLVAEGLTDPARKRPLPRFPTRIGVVTSATSAAMADVGQILRARWPLAALRIYDSQVQGDVAPGQLIRALKHAYSEHWAEVVLVVRGGGSLTDLMAFNDDDLVRVVAAAPMPTITGVGHETDTTLVDWVSDRYASTPSNAAELASPDQQDVAQVIAGARTRIARASWQRHQQRRQHLDRVRRGLSNPARLLAGQRTRLDQVSKALTQQAQWRCTAARTRLNTLAMRLHHRHPATQVALQRDRNRTLAQRLARALVPTLANPRQRLHHSHSQLLPSAQRRLDSVRQRLAHLTTRLAASSPTQVLQRGYAWVEVAGQIVSHGARLSAGAAIQLRMQDHDQVSVTARVESVQPRGDG